MSYSATAVAAVITEEKRTHETEACRTDRFSSNSNHIVLAM